MRGNPPDPPMVDTPNGGPLGLWLFSACFAGLLFLLASLALTTGVFSQDLRWMPVALHSLLQADYGADQFVGRFAPAKLSLVLDALHDASATDSAARFATLQARLNTPVPSVTPALGGGTAGLNTHTATSTVAFKPTSTQPAGWLPTSPRTPTSTVSPTATSWRTPTTTNPPIHTPRPDREPEPTEPQVTQPPTQPAPTKALTPKPTQPKPTDPYPAPPPYP